MLGILAVMDGDTLSATAKAATDAELAFINARKFRLRARLLGPQAVPCKRHGVGARLFAPPR